MRVREFVLAERQRSFPATKRGEVVGGPRRNFA